MALPPLESLRLHPPDAITPASSERVTHRGVRARPAVLPRPRCMRAFTTAADRTAREGGSRGPTRGRWRRVSAGTASSREACCTPVTVVPASPLAPHPGGPRNRRKSFGDRNIQDCSGDVYEV